MDDSTNTPLKRCTMCKQEFPATHDYFHFYRQMADGLYNQCKQCRNARNSERTASDVLPEGQKRCIGCKNIYPATQQYFPPHTHRRDGLLERCRPCAKILRKESAERTRDIIPDGHKRCSRCKQTKPATVDFFTPSLRHRYGVMSTCKECVNASQRKAYIKRRDVSDIPEGYKRCSKCKAIKLLTEDHFYLLKPRRKNAEWSPRCKECLNAEKKMHYENGKNRYFVISRFKKCPKCGKNWPCTTEFFARHFGNRDGLNNVCRMCVRIRMRAHHAANRSRILAVRRRYRITHRELIRMIHRNRYGRRKGAKGQYTQADIERQHQAQKGKCYYCGKKLDKYHIDHVIPLSRGGSNDPSNLVLACPTCNLRKNNKLPHEWPEGNRLL